jgi:hypothetical protein
VQVDPFRIKEATAVTSQSPAVNEIEVPSPHAVVAPGRLAGELITLSTYSPTLPAVALVLVETPLTPAAGMARPAKVADWFEPRVTAVVKVVDPVGVVDRVMVVPCAVDVKSSAAAMRMRARGPVENALVVSW